MDFDLTALVEDTLVDTHIRHRGERPTGGFRPDETVLAQLREAFPTNDALVGWLKLAMFGHMARTETTRSPFFINTMIFSEDFIAYLEKHRKYLLSVYGNANEAAAFERTVYADCIRTEQDFLSVCGGWYVRHGSVADEGILSMVVPSVWWIIWSHTHKRWPSTPQCWDQVKVRHNGAQAVFGRLMAEERAKLKTAGRRDVVLKAATLAAKEARMQWAARFGLVRLLHFNGYSRLADDSQVKAAEIFPNEPLEAADLRLFKLAKAARPLMQPVAKQRGAGGAYESKGGLLALAMQVGHHDAD